MKPGILIAIVGLSLPVQAETWPQFRGPEGNGVAPAEHVPARFGEDENLVWKTPLVGRGWSSPVFDGEHLWVTTAEEVFPDETERREILRDAGEEEEKFKVRQVAKRIDLSAVRIDYETGEISTVVALGRISNPQTIHTLNSFASPTPVLDPGGHRLFAHYGAFGTFCVDTRSGETEWQRTIELDHGVGPGSSPLLHDNLLVLICDGVDRQFVTALDASTGKTVWTTERPEMRATNGNQKKSYNTPLVIRAGDGRDQLVCMGAQWLVSYDPATGEEIWRLDHGSGFSVVPRPVFSEKHGLLYVSTGFGKPELLAVRPDGRGDVTGTDKVAWRETKRIPAKPSPLLVGDELYVIADGGVATCFDAETGEVHWTERIEGNYSASPLYADGRIYLANQEGKVTVCRPGRTFALLAENRLDGSLMASPIALAGSLVLRSDSAIYRFGK